MSTKQAKADLDQLRSYEGPNSVGKATEAEGPAARHQAPVASAGPTSETREGEQSHEGLPKAQQEPPGHAQAASSRRRLLKAHSLIDKVYRWENLCEAWKRVRRNKGAHGLDRVTINQFKANWEIHLREIQRKLMERRFEPVAVRRVYIPKASDSTQLRPLGIPTVADRIVQQAIVLILEPLFDNSMSSRSFGFRRGRKAHDAIATLIKDAQEGFRHVVDADIKSFFDKISHEVAMSRVRDRIADGRVLDLIEAFLKAGVFENGQVTVSTEGTPQGGVISPWLSNLVLDDLDKALEARGLRHVRYADDFVVLCRSRQEAEEALALVKEVLGRLGLSLHEDKSRLTDFSEGFEFLGFRFRRHRLGIRPKSIERFKERIRELTKRQQGRNVEAVLKDVTVVLRGWVAYFGVAEVTAVLGELDQWVRMRIRSFRLKRRSRHDNWRIPNRMLRRWGWFSMADVRPGVRLSYVCASCP